MSRIGKLSIAIPTNVKAVIDAQVIQISGPYGNLSRTISEFFQIKVDPHEISILPTENSRKARAMHGLSRTLISNMVIGVSKKFERRLEMKGVGYRAQIQGKELILSLGYSHPVKIVIPSEIEIVLEGTTNIIIRGIDKEKVGQLAATIRSKRLPEPYKGKGILYKNEIIKRKVGKSGK
jgi:large subunit ribosomal protein L6